MKRFFSYLILFLITVTVVGGYRLMRLKNPNAIYSQQNIDIYLNRPTNLKQLSTLLIDSLYVVQDKEDLMWAAKMLGWNTFKPGHYTIDGGLTYNQFLSKVARGAEDPVTVTILPGRMQEEILSSLAEDFKFDSVGIHEAVSDSAFLAKYNINKQTLIGHLFPETYKFYWTETPKEVLNKVFTKFKEAVEPFKSRLGELDKTLNDIITLASIIEGEAIYDSAKTVISGLYWNRLKSGMLLQADPTIIYVLGERRRLYFKDYKVKSPYNTYIHSGLPPGPINNPDLNSIKAALYPARHNYIYMVARPGGGHAFSKSYAQHLKKAEEWRQWLQKQVEIGQSQSKDGNSL